MTTLTFHEGKPPKRPETELSNWMMWGPGFTRASRRSGLRRSAVVEVENIQVSRGQAAEAA